MRVKEKARPAILASKPKALTRAGKIIAFIHKFCRVPEGDKVGQPIILDEFQLKFITDVYDNPEGTSLGILSISRKNGKTVLIACIVLAHLVGPEARQNSQIVSGAMSRKQAALVYNAMAKMVRLNPALSGKVHLKDSTKEAIGLLMNVEYQALAREAGTTHGLSPVLAIIDEMGQVSGDHDAFIAAIETAQGAYDDGLELVISTQAPTDADMLSIRIDDARRSNDPHIVCHVYSADDLAKERGIKGVEIELDDEEAWKRANPALGKFRSTKEIERKSQSAKRMPSLEGDFRNLYLNQRVNRNSPFLSPDVWREGDRPLNLEAFKRGQVFGGLDLAETTDLCAFVAAAWYEGEWHLGAWFWKPQVTVLEHSKRDRQPYDRWAADGWIETTPGVAVDYSFVATRMAEECSEMSVLGIAYDRFRFKNLEREFQKIGVELPMVEWGQGFVSMSPAVDASEIEFLNGRVCHGGNPVLTMCAANAVITRDAAGNRKLDKAKSTGRIDGMQATVMALGLAARTLAEGPSIYSDRGVIML